MNVILLVGAVAAVLVIILMGRGRPSASADSQNGRAAYAVKTWCHSSEEWFMRADHPSGPKVTLELFDRTPIVRLAFHNKTQDEHAVQFEQITEVRYLLNPSNYGGVMIDMVEPIQVGDLETDQLVLMFGADGASAGDVFDKLRDWLEPNTRFVFERQEGGQGRGGAMRV